MVLLNALAPFVPLAQTALWALLIIGLIVWFNKPIQKILQAFQRRVEAGNAVKAGWFELSELKPLSPEQQRQKTKDEVVDVISDPQSLLLSAGESENRTAIYLQYEDLALRAIQTEFDTPVVRQVGGAERAKFDAAFVKDGRLHVVEVKTYAKHIGFERLRSSVTKIAEATKRTGGPRSRLIVAVVYDAMPLS